METGETPQPSLEKLAAKLIGIDNRDPATATIDQIFRKLRDDDFLPDPISHEAILVLGGRPVGRESMLAQQLSETQEQRLHDDVERFAAEFFAFPVAERIDRWNSLMKACVGDIRRTERLRKLKPGLSIDARAAVAASAPVRRLVEDLLAIFPLPPSSRAAETRSRAERILSDPGIKLADRARTLKLLKNLHPEVAALSETYLEKLSPPRRPSRLKVGKLPSDQQWGRKDKPQVSQDSSNVRVLVTVAVVVISALSRLLTSNESTRTFAPFSGGTYPQRSPIVAGPPTLPSPKVPNLLVRDELKAKIRSEIDRIDRFLDEPSLDRIVARLPVEVVPNVGGMATLRLLGAWTVQIQARFAESLKEALRDTDLGLTDKELDELVARCLPMGEPPRGPRRPTPP